MFDWLPPELRDLVINVPLVGALALAVYHLWKRNRELERDLMRLLKGFVGAAQKDEEQDDDHSA